MRKISIPQRPAAGGRAPPSSALGARKFGFFANLGRYKPYKGSAAQWSARQTIAAGVSEFSSVTEDDSMGAKGRVRRWLLCLGLWCFVAAFLFQPASAAEPVIELLSEQGLERRYLVYAPERAAPEGGFALLLMLHGGGRTPEQDARLTRFAEIGEREGAVVVFPAGVGRHWNDGRVSTDPANASTADDVAFLRRVIHRTQERYPIDRKRTYVTGPSNGGMMTLRMACEATELFAAAAVVIASMPEPLIQTCRPARPLPMLLLNGTEDRLVPFGGGPVMVRGKSRGEVASVEKTLTFWQEHNGCSRTAERTRYPDLDPKDGTTVERLRYGSCRSKAEIVQFIIHQGGHRWPDTDTHRIGSRLGTALLGKRCHDLDTSEEIWRFFSGYTASSQGSSRGPFQAPR